MLTLFPFENSKECFKFYSSLKYRDRLIGVTVMRIPGIAIGRKRGPLRLIFRLLLLPTVQLVGQQSAGQDHIAFHHMPNKRVSEVGVVG